MKYVKAIKCPHCSCMNVKEDDKTSDVCFFCDKEFTYDETRENR